MIVLTNKKKKKKKNNNNNNKKDSLMSTHVHIYIYLEPKWPLFWFTRTLFWSGWASKYRTKSFQVHIYIYTYVCIYIYTYNQILHIYCKSSTTLWSILRLRSATKPGAAKGALQGSKTHQSLDLVENGKSCKLCFFCFSPLERKRFQRRIFPKGKTLGGTRVHFQPFPLGEGPTFFKNRFLKKKGPVSNSDCEVHSAAWTQIFGCFHPLVSHQHHGATARYALGMSCRGKRTRSHKCFRAV